MPKVYFRAADSKAISKDIADEVNYDKALQTISKKFKISKQNIKLVYNGQTKTRNFKLNPEIPHHIVHIQDKSALGHQEIHVSLTVGDGKGGRKIQNVKTKSNASVKELINHLVETKKIKGDQAALQSAEVFHQGKKLNQDETFLDHGVQNNANLNIMLKDDWPDPADIQLCAALLANLVDPITMQLKMMPKYFNLSFMIMQLKASNFFLHFQQKYEENRVNVIYTDYIAYRFPSDPSSDDQSNVPADNIPHQGQQHHQYNEKKTEE